MDLVLEGLDSGGPDRDLRARLGELLRAYYDSMQHTPLPDGLAALSQNLAQKLEEQNRKADPPLVGSPEL